MSQPSGTNPALVLHGFSLAILTIFMFEVRSDCLTLLVTYALTHTCIHTHTHTHTHMHTYTHTHTHTHTHTNSHIHTHTYTRTHSQVLIKIIAFRLKYFTHKFEVFDGIVVVISWTLDVASMYVIDHRGNETC